MRQGPPGDPERMDEGERVGIAGPRERAQRGLVHQGAEREVRQEEPPGFLPHELGRLTPEQIGRASCRERVSPRV